MEVILRLQAPWSANKILIFDENIREDTVSKNNKTIVLASLVILLAGGVWFAVGRGILAKPSHATYQMPTYEYEIEVQMHHENATNALVEDGIFVHLKPNRPAKDATDLADAYLQASHQRALKWIAENRTGPLDLMIIFARPLSLEQANNILSLANAEVFESAVVGYRDGIPFAGYSVEEGPLLVRSIQEYVEMGVGGGVAPEITQDNEAELARASTADIRGYLAVRAWVDAQNLDVLLEHKDIRVVDTTPQEVRDQVLKSPTWRHRTINHLTIEMPVWAYDW